MWHCISLSRERRTTIESVVISYIDIGISWIKKLAFHTDFCSLLITETSFLVSVYVFIDWKSILIQNNKVQNTSNHIRQQIALIHILIEKAEITFIIKLEQLFWMNKFGENIFQNCRCFISTELIKEFSAFFILVNEKCTIHFWRSSIHISSKLLTSVK